MNGLDIFLVIVLFCLICSLIIIFFLMIFFKAMLKNQENKLILKFSEILTDKKINIEAVKHGRTKEKSN
jgi:sensor histidine kinase regulating citrate/malate metabolism